MRLVDGNNLLHRVGESPFGGVHPVREVYTRFASTPETTIIVWDGPYANKRRQEIFPEYKANRRPKEESKFKFFEVAKGVLRFTPVIQVEIPGWEADDIIGTMINRWHKQYPLIVETNDGDYWQHSDKCALPLVSKKWHGMSPDMCLLYKSTVGESKDNVKGMRGFGEGTWDKMSMRGLEQLLASVKTQDQDIFFQLTEIPPKIRTVENFGLMCLCWKLNQCWEVPEKEIDDAMQVGKLNIAAAEHFMDGFLI